MQHSAITIAERCVLLATCQQAFSDDGLNPSTHMAQVAHPPSAPEAEAVSGADGSGDEEEPADEAEPQGEAPPQKRKRKRKSKYQPNEAEQAANERAAQVAPLLQHAVDALRSWMAASGCDNLLQLRKQLDAGASHHGQERQETADLGIAGASGAPRRPTRAAERQASQPGSGTKSEAPCSPQPCSPGAGRPGGAGAVGTGCSSGGEAAATGCGVTALEGSRAAAAAVSDPLEASAAAAGGAHSAALSSDAPDYVQLLSLRHVLRPKFEWEQQQLPGGGLRCNLFGQLVRNGGEVEAVGLAAGHSVTIPPGAAFLMSDIKQLNPLLEEAEAIGGFDCIVIDPPWENKSAARGSKYPTLPSRNLLALPIPALLAQDRGSATTSAAVPSEVSPAGPGAAPVAGPGAASEASGAAEANGASSSGGGGAGAHDSGHTCYGTAPGVCSTSLVALWVTNRERHRRFIERELLPAWGLRHVATWYWLKVTASGEPVGRLDIAHRRPYEPILLCRPACSLVPPAAGAAQPLEREGGAVGSNSSQREAPCTQEAQGASGPPGHAPAEVPDGVVLMSVPAQHSRKPHLGPLLRPYLPPEPRCLEMFARELFPGWTSWGNECLKFQGRGAPQPTAVVP